MNARTENRIADRIFAAALLLAGVGALILSIVLAVRTPGVNGGTFPLIVSAAWVLFGILNLIFVFCAKPDAPRGSLSSVLWMMLLLCAVGAALLLHVPFWVVCPVFLFVASFVVLKQRWLPSLIAAAVTTGAVYLVFAVLFHVPLP